MGMSPETIASGARSHDGLPRRAAGPAVTVPRVRCSVLAVLLGLVAAAASDPADPRPRASMLCDALPRGPARAQDGGAARPAGDARSLGRELFARTWSPDDPRCHGGDGLGPVYNATSCVACHGLGGPGGAGPSGMNVQLISAVGDEITGEFGFRSNQITVGNRSDPRVPDLTRISERESPQIRGRVSRMKSGRIGRFGWKAQTTDLREFVLGACAGELGLEVPGHPQAISPLAPDLKARALDLTPAECDALVAYVKALPAPIRLDDPDSPSIEAGRQAFEQTGCADCHRPSLGNIDGIYSDLLLHDMGPDLTSVTVEVYYGPPEKVDVPTAASMADGTEWRTPPLWGYRDSGPYLHDGRARNLVEAVRAHKGQARDSAARFLRSPHQRQSLIERFLKALAAPAPAEPTVIADGKEPSERRGSLPRPPASLPPARRGTALTRAEAVAPAKQERIAASRLKLAESLEKMDKPQGALVFYREIIRDEPDTDAARIAAERMKALGGEVAAQKGP